MTGNFDADYCYSLGYTASMLIANGKTGYMSSANKASATGSSQSTNAANGSSKPKSNNSSSKNKFNNFNQRNNDYDKLEKLFLNSTV